MLRLLHKHYGGIDWFEDIPIPFIVECILNGVRKEMEIPKLINKILGKVTNQPVFEDKKQMRSSEEILKDYGVK